MSAQKTTAERIADFALCTDYEHLPDAIRLEAPRAMHNWVGCVLGGMHHESVAIARRASALHAGKPEATVLGGGPKLDPINAAMVNCLASSAYAFDDTHLATVTHPTGPVASALLALAEWRPQISGEAFATALMLGIEVECRLASALLLPPARGNVGWYITGVTGGIAAALAVCKAMRLSHGQMVSAIGLAAAQASGFRATHGSMAIGFVPANAARAGLQSAILAWEGFDCSAHSLDGPNGLAQVFAVEANMAAVCERLGTHWEALANTYKPYPCGIVIHPAVDLCLAFRRTHDAVPVNISHILLRVHPLCLTLCDRPAPQNAADALVSLQHWVAASLVRGSAGLAEASDGCVQDSAVRSLLTRIESVADDSLALDAAVVRIEHSNGVVWEKHVKHCLGSQDNPMSKEELNTKFLAQAEGILSELQARALMDLCWRLPDMADAAAIARAAQG